MNTSAKRARLTVLVLAVLLAAAGLSLQARYSKSPFVRNAFPKPVSDRIFSIPLDPARLMVVYPAALEPAVKRLGADLAARCGREIPFRAADGLQSGDLAGKNLVILGNISDNRWALDLYKQRRAFADAVFPGPGGVIIHPAESIWDRACNVLVVGVSSDAGLFSGFESFLGLIPAGAQSVGPLHMLKTSLQMPSPPPNAAKTLADARKNIVSAGGPYAAVADWGLNYFLTGDRKWAELFREGFSVFFERAEKSGDWVPEAWTNIYFSLRGLFLAWDLLDDDPFFGGPDRKMIEEVLWGFTGFVRKMNLLDRNIAVVGEPRQNHTSHTAFGLDAAYRYYTKKYGLPGLEPMAAQVELAFDLGQANSYRPNDDASGYVFITPGDYYAYALAKGDESALKSGKLRTYMDLLAATTDNRGETVTFGDVGGYTPREKSGGRSQVPHFARLAAWYYGDGQYQWLADWLSRPGSPGNLALGDYAAPVKPEPPARYAGITSVELDPASLGFASRRAEKPSWLPVPGRRYFDKIALRRGFDPQDEFLSLEGTSFFSHGHFDGNAVTRLTWKDRIWLFDLHYINSTPRYHSGVTVTFAGRQDDPPPLTSLDAKADFPAVGLLQTTSSDFNRSDWTRRIVWRKGRYFLFLDTVKALDSGDYRLDCRWRTRGDITLQGGLLKVLQGDQAFFIKSADEAPRSLVEEPDGYQSVWDYPYGNGKIGVCLARRRASLARNEAWTFANLMYAADASDRASVEIARIADGVFGILDGGEREIAGTDPGVLAKAGIATDSRLFLCGARGLSLAGLTYLRLGGLRIDSSAPVHVDMDPAKGEGLLVVPEGSPALIEARGFKVEGAGEGPGMTLKPGSYRMSWKSAGPGFLDALRALGESQAPVAPGPWGAPFAAAGLVTEKRIPLSDAVSAFCADGESLLVGDVRGRVARFRGGERQELFQVESAKAIAVLKAADIDGDGVSEIIAGDEAENLYAYGLSGRKLWAYKMTPFNGSAVAADIAVGDVDGKGRPTILVATRSWKLYAFRPDGGVRWEAFLFYHPGTRVGILSGPKQPTVIAAGNVYHTPLNVVSPADGRVLWFTWEQCGAEAEATTDYCGFYLTDLLFLDTDGDGVKEIVFGTKYNRVYALSASDGATKWCAVLGDEIATLAKMTDPAASEEFVLAGTDSGDLVKLDRRGRVAGSLTLSAGISGLSVAGDPGKKRSDIVVSTRDGGIVVVDQDLSIRATGTISDSPLGLVPAGRKGGSLHFYSVSAGSVCLINYPQYDLRKSRDY